MAMLSFDIRTLDVHAIMVDGELNAGDPVWQHGDAMPRGSVRATGRLSSAGGARYYWHCHIAGTALVPCRRCLIETSVDVEDEAHLIFAASDTEEAEDPDVYTFGPRDRDLDLRPAVRELWLLNAPSLVLCRPDCQGLCARCGADLNQGPCACGASAETSANHARLLDSTTST